MSGCPIKDVKKLLRIPIREESYGVLHISDSRCGKEFCFIDLKGIYEPPHKNQELAKINEHEISLFDPQLILKLINLDELTIFRDDGSIEWSGKLKKTPRVLVDFNNGYSFLPLNITLEVWIKWFKQKRPAKLVRYSKK